MREPSQRPANGASPGLTIMEGGSNERGSLPPPSIESAADLAERAGAQFLLVDELRRSDATAAELAGPERILREMLRELRLRAPRGSASFIPGPRPFPLYSNILGEVERRFVARGGSRGYRRMLRAARPFQMELLRTQFRFNEQLTSILVEPERYTGTDSEAVQSQLRQLLEPLADPTAWLHQSHRKAAVAKAVGLLKRSGVAGLSKLLRPALERMRSWNHIAIEALLAGTGDSMPTRAQAQEFVRRLEAVADPCPPELNLPELWRETLAPQRDFTREATRALARHLAILPPFSDVEYRQWCAMFEPARMLTAARAVRQLRQLPSFSVLVGARELNLAHWRECIGSLLAQSYELWELCVAGPEHALEQLRGTLPPEWTADSRLRFIPSAASASHGAALNLAAKTARGEALVFIDPADRLAPHALAEMALALDAQPEARMVYSDEDRLDGGGNRCRPFFKPDWSRDMQRACDYASRLLVMRRKAFEELGGIQEGFDGAELYELVLRASESSTPAAHVTTVLYHRRETPRAFHFVNAAAHVALTQHLSRCGEEAEVQVTRTGTLRVRPQVKGSPRVSIIVPFKDKPELLQQLWSTFSAQTRWENWQLILVSNNSVDPRTHALLEELEDPRILKLTWNHPFNYSAINNFAARYAKGELLLFLNNDIEIIEEGWLEELIAQAQRPEVGVVGPMLLFPNRSIQHAGVVLGPGGFATHAFWRGRPDEEWTPFGRADCIRDFLAVTGACMMMRREVFEQVGGYDERMIVSGSDVELALRVVGRGLRCVYTPHACLVHHESATRRFHAIPDRDAWLSYSAFRPWTRRGDPFYNPNLTFATMDSSLRTDERTAESLAVQMLAWELPATQALLGPR
ncbi:glycosyltransferase family 2 protein [Hyalangium rubrum]|uniref:Glycosyltransferase family 2 protein n=1 Tax=Hyalangium rubrum TaxID=3103134 RepID=A0ABU5HI36_9BACT|nr:glycosyltransferase family 2 protein [Hyalangium sp. s54d21]MDY7233132.1 glycosyltransferase family 2 protein [Hyalangium sp. s54d21]